MSSEERSRDVLKRRAEELKGHIKNYLPILFELLGELKLNWTTIAKRYDSQIAKYRERLQRNPEPILIEVSLFGVIVSSIVGDKDRAVSFLDFIRKLLEELTDGLTGQEKLLLEQNIFGLLTNIDLKYLNYLGELCVLNRMKRNTTYMLVATEDLVDPKVKGGISIDFKFQDLNTQKILLIEVVNIHLNEIEIWSEEKLHNHFTQKIQEKLNSKRISKDSHIQLVPVLWGSISDIKKIKTYYETAKPQFQNTNIPVCFISYRYENGPVVHKFGSIDTLLD